MLLTHRLLTNPFICEDDWDHDLADYIDDNAGVKVHWYTAPSNIQTKSSLELRRLHYSL